MNMMPRVLLRLTVVTALSVLIFSGPDLLAGGLEFYATPLKDTCLRYESVWIRFAVRNTGLNRRVYRPLLVGRDCVNTSLRNIETGQLVRVCAPEPEYVPGKDESKLPGLSSGEEYTNYEDLIWVAACTLDSSVRLPYFSPGRYRAVFEWTYDPFRRALQDGVTSLKDSADFVVINASGEDTRAQSAYLEARRQVFEQGNAAGATAYWQVAQSYPHSAYASQALTRLLNLMAERTPLPRGITLIDVTRAFVLSSPQLPQSGRLLKEAVNQLDQARGVLFLQSICDSAPGTLAARMAKDLMREGRPK